MFSPDIEYRHGCQLVLHNAHLHILLSAAPHRIILAIPMFVKMQAVIMSPSAQTSRSVGIANI